MVNRFGVILKFRRTSLVGRMFANGPGDRVQFQVKSYQRPKNST